MASSDTALRELKDARDQGLVNIGAAAAASGVSAKMIRHYERIGLIPPPKRTVANYRLYSHDDVHILQFVRRARDLGFSLPAIQELLALWQDRRRQSADVRRIALEQVTALDVRIAELQSMRRTLRHLAASCHGDRRPDCPILDDLAESEPPVGKADRRAR
jgi:MerR family transcriptional regulator, copper efflux regulator